MDKTHRLERRRVFLIENLPEPLKPSDRHLQIFDNYLENTRLRLRSARAPETKIWTFILQQRLTIAGDAATRQIAEIYLNEAEHRVFEIFEGREIRKNERAETNEIRKNRYFYDFGGRRFEIDIFLGNLRGLNLAHTVFASRAEAENFEMPPFAVAEVTDNPFFAGENLVGRNFAEVRAEFARMEK